MDVDRWWGGHELGSVYWDDAAEALRASGIPVVAVAAAIAPGVERFGGIERIDGVVTNVRIVYDGEPYVSVETSRWDGTRLSSGPLRMAVEHHMRLHGDRFSAVTWREGAATGLGDGAVV